MSYTGQDDSAFSINKSIAAIGVNLDRRSEFPDLVNNINRPFISKDEVYLYYDTAFKRKGRFSIFINDSGTLNTSGELIGGETKEFWFKDSLENSGLVEKQSDLSSVDEELTFLQSQINLKANSSDINSPLNIKYVDLVTNTYTNILFSNQNAILIYYDTSNVLQSVYVTFDSAGKITLPFTAASTFTGTLIGITGALGNYVTMASVKDAINSTAQNFRKDNVITVTNSYDTTLYTTGYQDTTNTFSGWGTPVGIKNNFNAVKLFFKTRTIAVTSIRVQVRLVNSTGTILADKTFSGLNLPASTNTEFTAQFDALIANDTNSQLYVMYACNAQIDRRGTLQTNTPYPYPTYAIASYAQLGSQTMTFTLTSVSGNSNRATQIDFLNIQAEYNPTAHLITAIKNGIPELVEFPAIKELATKTSYFRDIFTGSAIWDEGLAALQDATSVFSGWGSPIGVQQNFNGVICRIRARSSAITSIYYELRSTDRNGAILYSNTMSINIPSNTTMDVLFKLADIIPNTSGLPLWFGYQCNQLCTAFGLSVAPFIYNTPLSFYRASGIQDGNWSAISGGAQRNIWAKVGLVSNLISPTNDFMGEINRLVNPVSSFSATAEIIHQKDLYAVEGTEYNLYFENMIFGNLTLDNYAINVNCPIGKQYDRYYRVLPTSGNASTGTFTLTLDVLFNGQIIASKTFILHVASLSAGNGISRSVGNFGDSTLSTGANLIAAQAKLSSGTFNVTFKGTQGTSPNKHEGYGGYRFTSFTTAGTATYYFYYSGVTNLPGIGSVYSNNGSQFTIDEINSGTGYFSGRKTSGSNQPLSSGTLSNVSGSGDVTISYSSVTIVNGNPLWNTVTGQLDIPNYLTTNSITYSSSDWVMFQLLINDQFGQTDDSGANSAINSAITACNTLISAWKSAVPGIRICIKIPIAPSNNQYSFGIDYGTGQYLDRYIRNWNIACRKFLETFDTDLNKSNNIFVLHYNSTVDRIYNMQRGVAPVNAANPTVTIPVASNGVHPASTGYIQMGWCDYAFLKNKV